ncbi:MAG: hypothetical protein KDB63_21125, partial [Nocardioidaceae bacterium]|nr:hypothetical protein [Nocardioidaceae bacterium]
LAAIRVPLFGRKGGHDSPAWRPAEATAPQARWCCGHLGEVPRHISPRSLHHAAIANALDAGIPLRDAQIVARHTGPGTTEHCDRVRGNLDQHGVDCLTAYVSGV